jgi:branched-chain amino acid transport system ATP-binding protein
MLRVRNLYKSFGGVAAVQDVSFDVPMGAVVALIGSNGAGKSTTFNLISGALRPDAGEIQLSGERLDRLSQQAICHRGVGRTYQISQLFEALTVRENVITSAIFGVKGMLGQKEAEKRADEILDTLALSSRQNETPKDLTLAERRRVEIARALVMRPKLLLLDEVLAGLTGSELDDAIALIRRLRTTDFAILLVEHQMRAVMQLADSVVVMVNGQLLMTGEPDKVRKDPRVLAAYLGDEFNAIRTGDVAVTPPGAATAPVVRSEGARAKLLDVSGLSAGYGEVLAIRDVSLSVGPSEVVALIGSNGMGKSTTLNAISGVLPVRKGTVRFNGMEFAGRAAHEITRAGLAQVPAGRQLFPYMSVTDNLLLGSAFLPGAWEVREATLSEVFSLFPRLLERGDLRAGVLSGGEQQMVAIGRALMGRPQLLMFDEPSIGLAPKVVAEVFESIARVAASGIGVLLVEQNVSWALRVASRVYLMESGMIVSAGRSEDLRADPSFLESFGLSDDLTR